MAMTPQDVAPIPFLTRIRREIAWVDHFMGGDHGETGWENDNSGSGGAQGNWNDGEALTVDNKTFGTMRLTTGGDSTGSVGLHKNRFGFRLGGGQITMAGRILIPTLSTGSDEFEVRVGASRFTAADTNGLAIIYDRTQSANWRIAAQDGGGDSFLNSSVVVTAATWHWWAIVVNALATSVEYFMDDVSLGIRTANIPDGATEYLNPHMSLRKTVGTNERKMFSDLYAYHQYLTVPH